MFRRKMVEEFHFDENQYGDQSQAAPKLSSSELFSANTGAARPAGPAGGSLCMLAAAEAGQDSQAVFRDLLQKHPHQASTRTLALRKFARSRRP